MLGPIYCTCYAGERLFGTGAADERRSSSIVERYFETYYKSSLAEECNSYISASARTLDITKRTSNSASIHTPQRDNVI